MIRVTIAVPDALLDDAAHLASALGLSEADALTFAPGYALAAQDAQGRSYRVASGLVSEAWPGRAQAPLVAPEWPVDLAAAARAQALVRVGQAAAPDVIAVQLGLDPAPALAALGLTP